MYNCTCSNIEIIDKLLLITHICLCLTTGILFSVIISNIYHTNMICIEVIGLISLYDDNEVHHCCT